MTKNEFRNLCEEKVIVLDGGTGTELQKKGMPTGVCPEQWVLDNPQVIQDISKKYIENGSDIVLTCTFGGNKIKLKEFGLDNKIYEINKNQARLSKEAVADSYKRVYVAGDIGPTGKLIAPLGDGDFEEIVSAYEEQVQGLLDGGVDLFAIETMISVQEARCAVLAIRKLCDLPIMVTLTFEQNGKTLTGTSPVSALVTLVSLGIDAFGINCGTGPDKVIEILEKLKPYSPIPLIGKPNAGLPTLVNGKTVFSMDSKEFGTFGKPLVNAGANIIGGCCGTDYDFIRELKESTKGITPLKLNKTGISGMLSSNETYVNTNNREKTLIIGERINPTGKKQLQQNILQGNYQEIIKIGEEQKNLGVDILDVNIGMANINEEVVMLEVIKQLSYQNSLPLCIDSSNPRVIEKALRNYPGRALVNSISLEKIKLEKILPIVKYYGGMVICLPLSDEGLPKNLEERISNIKKLIKACENVGINKRDIIIDGLVMTVSSSQSSGRDTIDTIKWCSDSDIKTVIGLSNVSFGLPQRSLVNSSFMAIATYNGLTMAIANPSATNVMDMKYSSDVISGRDKNGLNYIEKYGEKEKINIKKSPAKIFKEELEQLSKSENNTDKAYVAIIKGDKKNIVDIIKDCLNDGIPPSDLIDNYLIKAITRVGDLFEEQIYFLPQLILSASSMEKAFEYLKPLLKVEKTDKKTTTIALATVKGDIHDIGKNILALMLRNNGYNVIDLGNDVHYEKILQCIKENNVDIVGLSALMTTTMIEMKKVIAKLKEDNVNVKVMIGGAVITEEYGKSIGADGYAKDAAAGVKWVKSLYQ